MGASSSLLSCVKAPAAAPAPAVRMVGVQRRLGEGGRRLGEGGRRLGESFRGTASEVLLARQRLRQSFRGKVNVFNQRCGSLRRRDMERRSRSKTVSNIALASFGR